MYTDDLLKIDLLTIEEVKKLPREIRKCKTPQNYNGFIHSSTSKSCIWWTRTPQNDIDDDISYIYYVGYDGQISKYLTMLITDLYTGVRPILKFRTLASIDMLPQTKKGYIKFLNTTWINISDYIGYPCLLKRKSLKKARHFDRNTNAYGTSELKKYLEKWLKKKLDNQ